MQKFLFTFLSVFFGLYTIGEAQVTTIPQEVKDNIGKRVDKGINPGIVVGVIDATCVTYYSYGVKSLNSKIAVDENSVFAIASITKTFTGILLADLVVKGELNLNAPLQALLPQGIHAPTKNGQSIELVQLANHTSSLPNLPSDFDQASLMNPFADYDEGRMYNFLKGYELSRDIGSEYEYSNYGMGLLGYLLARREGKNYEDLLAEKIIKPLKLKNTSTVITPQMKKNLVSGHKIGVEVPIWDYLPPFAGAAGIRSNAQDMLQYLAYNMGIAQSSLYPAIQLSHRDSRKEDEMPRIGLGWEIIAGKDTEIIMHSGESGGYCSFLGFSRDGTKGVVVLTNANVGVTDIGMHLLDASFLLNEPKPAIGAALKEIIDTLGMQAALKAYWSLRESQADNFDFSQDQLDMLGQLYIWDHSIDKALSIFKLNTVAFPNAFDVYNSNGDALLLKNDTAQAIAAFRKSIELNPDNHYGMNKLERLGVETEGLRNGVVVEESILKSYEGNYELFPGFILTVSKQGDQLKVQATGKPEYPIYPKAANRFYFKVLPAQITFNSSEKGEIISLTYVQEGEEIVGKRIRE